MNQLVRSARPASERRRRQWQWKERQRGTTVKLLSALLGAVLGLLVTRTTTAEMRRLMAVGERERARRLARRAA